MTARTVPARTVITCDRCRIELTDENTRDNGRRGWMTKMTSHRFLRKGMVSRALDRRPTPYVSEIHFCDGCWWEFDRLFLQGQAVNIAPGVKYQDPKWITPEHGRLAVEASSSQEMK
jgi:hypothetical protein